MPRYRFRWELIPRPILRDLKRALDLSGDAAHSLQVEYGARPSTEFIRDVYPVLRDGWLKRDGASRRGIVDELRNYGLGNADLPVRTKQDQLAYLATCRNSETLRQVVLAFFHELGDVARSGSANATREEPSRKPEATSRIRSTDGSVGDVLELDRVLESAWETFAFQLEQSLASLATEQILIFDVPSAYDDDELVGAAPYVQFKRFDEETLCGEVSSDAYLDEHHALTPVQVRRLLALGWKEPSDDADDRGPSSDNFSRWVEPAEARVLVPMTIGALREVFGVPHPSFLATNAVAGTDDVAAPALPFTSRHTAASTGAAATVVISPTGRAHLRELVDAALAKVIGHPPVHDPDDDIPLRSGSAMVFLRVAADVPILEMFCPLLRNVAGSALCLERLNERNKLYRFVRFTWDSGTVYATAQVWCDPFVESSVIQAVQMMCDVVDEVDDDLQLGLGGQRFFGSDGEDDNDGS